MRRGRPPTSRSSTLRRLVLKHKGAYSPAPPPVGQDLQAIIEDLCAIVREWYSDSRHAPRAISAACISAIEQLCRHPIALRPSGDGSTMPQTLTIVVVSLARAMHDGCAIAFNRMTDGQAGRLAGTFSEDVPLYGPDIGGG